MKSKMNLQFNLDHETDDIRDEDDLRLESRMEEFKKDPEKMRELTEFVDEVLKRAHAEVDGKSASKVVSSVGGNWNITRVMSFSHSLQRSDKDKFREGECHQLYCLPFVCLCVLPLGGIKSRIGGWCGVFA